VNRARFFFDTQDTQVKHLVRKLSGLATTYHTVAIIWVLQNWWAWLVTT
jgi:hypothetical protein